MQDNNRDSALYSQWTQHVQTIAPTDRIIAHEGALREVLHSSIVDQLRPYQEASNITLEEAMARHPMEDSLDRRGGRNERVFDAQEEEEIDRLARQAEIFEQQIPKKMEATKPRKSIYKHRFSDAPWFEWLKKRDVIILGAGGIGSWVTFALARIGCSIHVYDMDTIEPHNLGGQLYSVHDVGQNKAVAIASLSHNFSGGESDITSYGRFDEDSPIGTIVISCFDNMASRALAFNKWSEALASDLDNAQEYLFIDGRLLAEDYQVYGVVAGRLDAYKETLFEDGEVADAMCSLKATTHCSMGIASDIVGLLTNFATNRSMGMDVREVPFSIIKSMSLFMYELKLEADEHSEEIGAEGIELPVQVC